MFGSFLAQLILYLKLILLEAKIHSFLFKNYI